MNNKRFFNTAGPVNCDKHYCLSPLERVKLEEILPLIEQEKYFVLHAPRQTGKTSCLLALMDYLNGTNDYRCLYANVEIAQAPRENVAEAMRVILGEMASWAEYRLNDHSFDGIWRAVYAERGGYGALGETLSRWCAADPRPVVLLIDEIDSLVGDTLISMLRQIRAGYAKRPAHFPQSILLCGVRDVRDYRIHSDQEKAIITGGSAFNIKAESLRLGDFTREETKELYRQHTNETGQAFEPAALDLAWELTRGQPWLVNALAYETCFKMKEGRDRSLAISAKMMDEAKERMIMRRETHLDQLVDKLKEDRVRRVIEPILEGQEFEEQFHDQDVQYVLDLGLISQERAGALHIANPIYREIIPRALAWNAQMGMSIQTTWFVAGNGRLLIDKLLSAFQEFFREHSESWVERFDYKEAGPQLLMQAFLQRIMNAGGRIEREYGLGRKRTDLLVIWPYPAGVQKAVIELKILHRSLETTIAKGVEQTWEYMDRSGAEEGHLVIFDRAEGKPWEDKIFRREEEYRGIPIMVWGM